MHFFATVFQTTNLPEELFSVLYRKFIQVLKNNLSYLVL